MRWICTVFLLPRLATLGGEMAATLGGEMAWHKMATEN